MKLTPQQEAARILGSIKTEKKAAASRENGKKGGGLGRPRMKRNPSRLGKVSHPLHGCWSNMRRRCSPAAPLRERRRYYDRGIRVCPEWEDWDTFADFALANGWRIGLTIDRIDNDLGYFPANVRFVSPTVNVRNRDMVYLQRYNAQWALNSRSSPLCRGVIATSPDGEVREFKIAADAARFFGFPEKVKSTIYYILKGIKPGQKYLKGWSVCYADAH